MTDECLAALSTETPNPRSANMDQMAVRDLLMLMNDEDQNAVRAVREAIPAIERAVDVYKRQSNFCGWNTY